MTDTILPIDNVLYMPSMSLLFDDLNLVILILPRFLGIEMRTKDPRYDSAKLEYEKVNQLYLDSGHPERSEFTEFEGGHEVSIPSVVPFLMRWIETPAEELLRACLDK